MNENAELLSVTGVAHGQPVLLNFRWTLKDPTQPAPMRADQKLPPSIADRLRYPVAFVDRVRELAHSSPDAEIANRLKREGHASAKGKPFSAQIVRWIRWRHQIAPAVLKKSEELTVQEVAEHFGVSPGVVYYWIERSLVQARRLNRGMPYWITLNWPDEQKLQDWVRNSTRIQKGKASQNAPGEGGL